MDEWRKGRVEFVETESGHEEVEVPDFVAEDG